MAAKNWEYDVFISYSRADSEWVQQHLRAPLLAARQMADGRPARVFLDVSEQGVAQGASFLSAIADAIRCSRKIVLVYSPSYFDRPMCQWEMSLALLLDPIGREGRLVPVLRDEAAADSVPFMARVINWRSVGEPDWFPRLCGALELRPAASTPTCSLCFLETPSSALLGRALPSVRVALNSGSGHSVNEAEVTLSCDGGSLKGTLVRTTVNGVATFDDLAVSAGRPSVTLVAASPGIEPARSRALAVTESRTARSPAPDPSATRIPVAGEAVFLGDGSLAVASADLLQLYSADLATRTTHVLAEARLERPLRLLRKGASVVVAAEWSGRVHVLGSDGSSRSWTPDFPTSGLRVPADVSAASDGTVHIGYWEGTAFSWSPRDLEPVAQLRHVGGIQCLTETSGRMLLVDFEGILASYRNGRWVNTAKLEPRVQALRAWGDVLVAVGAERLHHVELATMQTLSEETGLRDIQAVLPDSERPVVIDAHGKGFRIDCQLAKTSRFYVAPGLVPVSADDAGRACSFRAPDGSYALLLDGLLVLAGVKRALAVSGPGDRFALGQKSGIRVVDGNGLRSMLTASREHAADA